MLVCKSQISEELNGSDIEKPRKQMDQPINIDGSIDIVPAIGLNHIDSSSIRILAQLVP